MDASLFRSMERVFANTEARVVAAYKMMKCTPSTTTTFSARRRPPKSKGKERIVCLTAERRTKRRGFKGSLHVCKVVSGTLQVQKSWLLKYVTRLDAFPPDAGEDEASSPAFIELWIANSAFTNEARKAFQVSGAALIEVVGSLYLFCKKHERKPPAVNGIDVALLEMWAAQQQGKGSPLDGIGAFGAALLGGQDSALDGDADSMANMVSAKEEHDLQTLLEMFAMGVGDVEHFQLRLQDELAALEAANVHAVLESGPLVQRVQVRLNDSISLINDLDETLAIFDVKLRHMREDIAAIESRNNRLELQTRNNGKLMATLEEVLGRLELSEDTQDLLEQTNFDDANLEDLVAGIWEVQEHIDGLTNVEDNPKGLQRGLAGLSAVAEQHSKLQGLSKAFTERACRYLNSQLSHLGDQVLSSISNMKGSARRTVPDHRNIRQRARLLKPLMQVVQAVQPAAMPGLREAYTQALNIVIRKQLRLYASDLRKAVAMHSASNPAEPDMGLAHKRMDLLEGLQASKLSFSSRSDSESPLQSQLGDDSPYSSTADKGGPLPAHTAWQLLLDCRLAFLCAELQTAAEFLLLYSSSAVADSEPSSPVKGPSSPGITAGKTPLSPSMRQQPLKVHNAAAEGMELAPEGGRVLAALLDGIQADFHTLVDMVGKNNQILAVPMLREALRWREQLQGNLLAEPLLLLLADCCHRLRTNYANFILDRVVAIGRYEGKGGIGLPGSENVKAQHLLTFLPAFIAFVLRLQELLAEGQPLGSSRSTRHRPNLHRNSSSIINDSSNRGDDADDDDISAMSLTDDEEEVPQPSSQQARLTSGKRSSASNSQLRTGSRGKAAEPVADAFVSYEFPQAQDIQDVKDMVKPSYALLIRAMFQSIERLASTDAKHGDRLRLESYSFFVSSVSEAAQAEPVLLMHVRQATAAKQRAMQVYMQQQLEHGKFWKLIEFSVHVDQLMQEIEKQEVPFQMHYQANDLRALLQLTMHHPEKKVQNMLARVQKHMGSSSPGLVAEVWPRICGALQTQYERLAEQMKLCYPQVQMTTSASQLKNILNAVTVS